MMNKSIIYVLVFITMIISVNAQEFTEDIPSPMTTWNDVDTNGIIDVTEYTDLDPLEDDDKHISFTFYDACREEQINKRISYEHTQFNEFPVIINNTGCNEAIQVFATHDGELVFESQDIHYISTSFNITLEDAILNPIDTSNEMTLRNFEEFFQPEPVNLDDHSVLDDYVALRGRVNFNDLIWILHHDIPEGFREVAFEYRKQGDTSWESTDWTSAVDGSIFTHIIPLYELDDTIYEYRVKFDYHDPVQEADVIIFSDTETFSLEGDTPTVETLNPSSVTSDSAELRALPQFNDHEGDVFGSICISDDADSNFQCSNVEEVSDDEVFSVSTSSINNYEDLNETTEYYVKSFVYWDDQTFTSENTVSFTTEESDTNITNGLEAYYKLDEESGTTAEDSHGDNDGTASNDRVFTSGVGGILNTGADFTQGDDYIEYDPSFTTDEFTFSGWFKHTESNDLIMPVTTTGSNRPFLLYFNQEFSDVQVLGFDDNGDRIQPRFNNSELYDGDYHHLVVVMDYINGEADIYLDAVEQDIKYSSNGQTSSTSASFDNKLYIGGEVINNRRYYNGDLDEIGLWTRELSSSEVSDLHEYYNNDIGYPFEEPSVVTPSIEILNPTIDGNDVNLRSLSDYGDSSMFDKVEESDKEGEYVGNANRTLTPTSIENDTDTLDFYYDYWDFPLNSSENDLHKTRLVLKTDNDSQEFGSEEYDFDSCMSRNERLRFQIDRSTDTFQCQDDFSYNTIEDNLDIDTDDIEDMVMYFTDERYNVTQYIHYPDIPSHLRKTNMTANLVDSEQQPDGFTFAVSSERCAPRQPIHVEFQTSSLKEDRLICLEEQYNDTQNLIDPSVIDFTALEDVNFSTHYLGESLINGIFYENRESGESSWDRIPDTGFYTTPYERVHNTSNLNDIGGDIEHNTSYETRATIQWNGGDENTSSILEYDTEEKDIFDIEILTPISVTHDSAIIRAEIVDMGGYDEFDSWFLFEESGRPSQTINNATTVGTGLTSYEVTDLKENTTYNYAFIGQDDSGDTYATEKTSFTTLIEGDPVISTLPATNILRESARLQGVIDNLGDYEEVDYNFRYNLRDGSTTDDKYEFYEYDKKYYDFNISSIPENIYNLSIDIEDDMTFYLESSCWDTEYISISIDEDDEEIYCNDEFIDDTGNISDITIDDELDISLTYNTSSTFTDVSTTDEEENFTADIDDLMLDTDYESEFFVYFDDRNNTGGIDNFKTLSLDDFIAPTIEFTLDDITDDSVRLNTDLKMNDVENISHEHILFDNDMEELNTSGVIEYSEDEIITYTFDDLEELNSYTARSEMIYIDDDDGIEIVTKDKDFTTTTSINEPRDVVLWGDFDVHVNNPPQFMMLLVVFGSIFGLGFSVAYSKGFGIGHNTESLLMVLIIAMVYLLIIWGYLNELVMLHQLLLTIVPIVMLVILTLLNSGGVDNGA